MDAIQEKLNRLPGALLPWYRENRRVLPWRERVSAYRTWVSEIMLQQTRVAAVIPYFQRFMAAYPSVEALAACDEGQLMKLWEGLGYYSRARNLRRAAQIVAEQYGGAFPRTYEELTALPGIGDYTAGAILSIAFGEPVPAVDGNVLRVAARVGGCRLDILDQKNRRQFRRWMEAAMPQEAPGAFNQALMDLGAGVCLPNSAPLCDSCPAAAFCAAAFLLGSVPAARAASVCPPPQVSAACAALIDGRTGQTLYEKDADRRALIASTTKIMTGLLVCEAGEADRRVTVPSLAVGLEGSSMYLKRGETLTRQDLLYGMMLHSGNDAALTLAISVSGSEQAFVRQMNLRAQALGLRQTHFANPHGLDSGENYSSARDLAALTQAALQNQQFRTVVGTKTITCAGRTLTNHNKLLWRYDGCIGVKTGYTRHAGRILVSAAERGESQLIAVTLADPDDWRDHAALLDYGFAVLAAQTPVYPQNRRIVWKNDCKKFWRAAPASPAARLRS